MIEPGDRLVHRVDRGRIGRRRPAQHDDLNAERARGGDLAMAAPPPLFLAMTTSIACAAISARSSASLNGPRAVT